MGRFREIVISVLLVSCSCSEAEIKSKAATFTVTATYSKDLIPENVLLRINNISSRYICLSIAELRLGGGRISLYPEGEFYGSRPQLDTLLGMDVSEGLYIIKPNTTKDIFINISNDGPPKADSLQGSVRASLCEDLFTNRAELLEDQSIKVNLR